MTTANNKIFYTRDSYRNIFFFYAFLEDQRISLGHLHIPKDKPFDAGGLSVILRRYREVMPTVLNVHISDIIDDRGLLRDLKITRYGNHRRWVYTYVNGKKKTVVMDTATKRADALYFAELIKARYDIEDSSATALIVEHACLNLV
jgi:hypothetical protein